MKIQMLSLAIACLLAACGGDSASGGEKTIQEVKAGDKISSIIRNPVTANEPTDTVNVAKITFEENTYNFGTVKEGAKVEHVFSFTNTGKVPLIISNARSTCGCTVPSWPKEPIPPGGKGEIKVVFNTKGKKRDQTKPVTITANTYPSTTKVFLVGFVEASENQTATSGH